MVGVRVRVAAGGLHPLEACKAWYLRTEEERPWHEVQAATTTVDGQTPKMHALRNAVDRVAARRGALEAFAEGVEALGREFEGDAQLARALQGGGGEVERTQGAAGR